MPILRLQIRVTPRARNPGVELAADGALRVKVREPAVDGRANQAVVEAVAAHLGVSRRSVAIVRGATSRRKWIEISS